MFHIPELTDQVIDHLHADVTSLRNCALVARSWVPAAQFHIFFSVNIKHDATCRLLCDILAVSPHIARYIRNIYIYFEVTRPSFSSLLDLRLPEPRRLSIVNCPHTDELALIRHLIELPSLTDIRFFSGTSVSRAQLDYLARTRTLTTKLGHLLLYSASDTPAPEDEDGLPCADPLNLSALNVSGDATLVTHILADPDGPINLRTIEALTFDTNDIGCLQRLLTVCGADLVVLEILISSPTLASHIHIGSSTIPFLIDLLLYDITAPTLPAVLALLSQLDPRTAALRTLRLAPADSSSVETVSLSHAQHSPFSPTPTNESTWRTIDAALGALPHLVRVDVDVDVDVDGGTVQAFKACFPTLVRKDILKLNITINVLPADPKSRSPPASESADVQDGEGELPLGAF
ncbi:hypothetical protein B0H16DRAFT_241776 [Mycena metata]|uniref:Uncharacterized protein n=1 Tax=Mycena metata TaxID=1033252 RepID=A0AAD7HVT9_9AGAR|nr:hypothetical protein B0H16DRAFT_241776 [Mycena metata]